MELWNKCVDFHGHHCGGLRIGYAAAKYAMELLNISKASAYTLLRRLTEQGELVLIGARYYRTGTVVPPEEHYRVIREYLKREKGAYRKELAAVLQVETRSCSWILRGLVEEGKLLKDGQRYYLPDGEQ